MVNAEPHVQSKAQISCKRTIPNDFFSPISKRAITKYGDIGRKESMDLNYDRTGTLNEVPGLTIVNDFITAEEECVVLNYLNSAACSWRTDLIRRTMHFGGNYCLYDKSAPKGKAEAQIVEAPPLPVNLEWLVDRLVEAGVYREIGNKRPEYVIVNEYLTKMGISAHTENFSFHSPVVGLSLGSADVMRFHQLSQAFDGSVRTGKASRAPRTGRTVDVELPPRSLCIMANESRWSWQHEIRPVKRVHDFKRVSLTFRVKK